MVRYRTAGRGEPVVLVHGLSGSTGWWRRNVPALAARYRVYLVDLPGFGAMSRLGWDFDLTTAPAWLYEWMRAAGLSRAHLVGHSMGGYICLRLAMEHPEAVRRLALVASSGIPVIGSMPGYTLPVLRAGLREPLRFLPVLARDALRAHPAALWRGAQELLAQDVRDNSERVAAPTLLIWGERDPLVPLAAGEALRRRLPTSRLLILTGAGHVAMFDRPYAFNGALLAFLAGFQLGV